MGKQTKLREAQRHAAAQALAVRLRVHTPARTQPAFINSYYEFAPVYRDRIDAFRDCALRAPEDWRCGLRLRSPEQRFRELVRFTFAKYPVPRHLENAWIEDGRGAWLGVVGDGADGTPPAHLRRLYIIVGRGGSLYREATHHFMSKIETHHFVNAPDEIEATQRAFWYAIARAQTDDEALARRIARTRLARFSVAAPFWQDVARFFVQQPAMVHEMDDLIDYINAARQEDAGFTLKGRSLAALRRRMERWHRLKREETAGLRWRGDARPDVAYQAGDGAERTIWRFTQIKTSFGLVWEGQQMEHCVAVYQSGCVGGLASIWALTSEDIDGNVTKRLTIELDRHGAVSQCRGFANRLPTTGEFEMVRRWAAERDIVCNRPAGGALAA